MLKSFCIINAALNTAQSFQPRPNQFFIPAQTKLNNVTPLPSTTHTRMNRLTPSFSYALRSQKSFLRTALHDELFSEKETTDPFLSAIDKLPQAITFCHDDECVDLLRTHKSLYKPQNGESPSALRPLNEDEKASITNKLLRLYPKIKIWSAHKYAFVIAQKETTKVALENFIGKKLGTFITEAEINDVLQPLFEKELILAEPVLVDLTPLIKKTAIRFLTDTLLNDRHLANLREVVLSDASLETLFKNFFSNFDSPNTFSKAPLLQTAKLIAALKADEAFYWLQQKLALAQGKIPEWLTKSSYLPAQKIELEEKVLQLFRQMLQSDPQTSMAELKESLKQVKDQ